MGIKELTQQRNVVFGAFFERHESTLLTSFIPMVTTFVDAMNKETVKHRWLTRGPAMEKWNGTRKRSRLDTKGYDLSNEVFTNGIEVGVDEWRRDGSGQVVVRAQELAVDAALHPELRLTEQIVEAETRLCYDGFPFFSTDHPNGTQTATPGTNSNLLTHSGVTLTAVTATDVARAIIKGIKRIMSFKNEKGLPRNANVRTFTVMVPVNLVDVANNALNLQFLEQGASNIIQGLTGSRGGITINVVVNHYLPASWDNSIAVLATDGITRPFIMQEEVPTKMMFQGEDSPTGINNRTLTWDVERIYTVGYGRYEGACKVNLAA